MQLRGNNAGVLLAILAGVVALARAIWPIAAPQAYAGEQGGVWVFIAFVAGATFLAAAFLADRHVGWSKGLLFGGAVVLTGSALYFGWLLGAHGFAAALIDLVPALLGAAAGVLIGPIQRGGPLDRGGPFRREGRADAVQSPLRREGEANREGPPGRVG